MPLVRATLATALPTVRQLLGDLKKLARETGSSPPIDNLVQSLDGLDTFTGRRSLDVEVVMCSPVDPEEAGRLATWLGPGVAATKLLNAAHPELIEVVGPPLDLRIFVRSLGARVSLRAGTPRPPVLVLIATKSLNLSTEDRQSLERALEDRPHVLMVASSKAKFTVTVPVAPPAAAEETQCRSAHSPI